MVTQAKRQPLGAILHGWRNAAARIPREGVLEAVGSLVIDNVRELLGALNRLVAFQAVSDRPLRPEQARALASGGEPTAESAAPAATPSISATPTWR